MVVNTLINHPWIDHMVALTDVVQENWELTEEWRGPSPRSHSGRRSAACRWWLWTESELSAWWTSVCWPGTGSRSDEATPARPKSGFSSGFMLQQQLTENKSRREKPDGWHQHGEHSCSDRARRRTGSESNTQIKNLYVKRCNIITVLTVSGRSHVGGASWQG